MRRVDSCEDDCNDRDDAARWNDPGYYSGDDIASLDGGKSPSRPFADGGTAGHAVTSEDDHDDDDYDYDYGSNDGRMRAKAKVTWNLVDLGETGGGVDFFAVV